MKFIISFDEYLEVNIDDLKVAESDQDYSNWSKSIDITYINTQKNLFIKFANSKARSFCFFFLTSQKVKDLLSNNKQLSKTIINDLGFEWNQFFKGISKSNEAFNYHWMCNDHLQIRPYYNSWLYNDEQGNIIFEITPFYPWFYVTKKTNKEKVSYKEWIENYKPTIKTIIPHKNLKKWIIQAEHMKKEYNL